MSEQSTLLRFRENYPKFIGTLENSSDPTILMLKMISESESIGNNYYDYYLSEEYNMDSYLAIKLFNYNTKLNIPYKYNIQANLKIDDNTNTPSRAILPKYTVFKTQNSTYLLENSTIVNSYNSVENLTLIQGELKNETVNSQTMINNSSRYYKLSTQDNIYPNFGYLEIDNIKYTEYSIIDSKYSDSKVCYGVELSDDGNYYLILSQKLFNKIMINSKITLNFLVKDIENDGESFSEISTNPVKINNNDYNIIISQITINSKIRDQLESTTLLDFNTNISKFDYEENINSLESVIIAKCYDCNDFMSGSIIELDPENYNTWDVKLNYPSKIGSTDEYMPVPYYMYVVVASPETTVDKVMPLQLKKEIMDSIKNGLFIKEILLDYGTLSRGDNYQVSENNQGYKLSENYRPYKLPFIVDSRNSPDRSDKYNGYNMPDLVIQLEPASYIPVDVTLKLELSYDTLDDLMNFYLNLIDSIKSLFELSKSNNYLKFNSKLIKSDIEQIIYQYPQINTAIIENFTYYRDQKKIENVEEIQFAPFELPVLGKLSINLNLRQVPEDRDEFLKIGESPLSGRKYFYLKDTLRINDLNAKVMLKLEDNLKIQDSKLSFKHSLVNTDYELGITYWIASAEGVTESVNITSNSKSVIMSQNHSVDDDSDFRDDSSDIDSGLFTDGSTLKTYLNY